MYEGPRARFHSPLLHASEVKPELCPRRSNTTANFERVQALAHHAGLAAMRFLRLSRQMAGLPFAYSYAPVLGCANAIFGGNVSPWTIERSLATRRAIRRKKTPQKGCGWAVAGDSAMVRLGQGSLDAGMRQAEARRLIRGGAQKTLSRATSAPPRPRLPGRFSDT